MCDDDRIAYVLRACVVCVSVSLTPGLCCVFFLVYFFQSGVRIFSCSGKRRVYPSVATSVGLPIRFKNRILSMSWCIKIKSFPKLATIQYIHSVRPSVYGGAASSHLDS